MAEAHEKMLNIINYSKNTNQSYEQVSLQTGQNDYHQKIYNQSMEFINSIQNVQNLYTVHGILQARILEWVAFLFSRVSSQPKDQTQVTCIAGGFFTS